MPIMTHMGAAAPCGITTYRDHGFGNEYFDNLFVCYFNLRKIGRHVLEPDGATFRTRDMDFVTSDSLDFLLLGPRPASPSAQSSRTHSIGRRRADS